MRSYVQEQNIALYRRLLSESERDPSRDEDRYKMLLTLLADEMAKDQGTLDSQALAELFAETLMIAELDDEASRLPGA